MGSLPKVPQKYAWVVAFFVVAILLMPSSGEGSVPRDSREVKAVTWNIAAVNNNPFEYWITGSEQYNTLLKGFGEVVENPGPGFDFEVSELFTEKMAAELFTEMENAGWVRIDTVREKWTSELSKKKAISEFLTDKLIGKKRLVSMFDRVTNTIETTTKTVYRPSPINCYSGKLTKVNDWWPDWIDFIFTHKLTVKTKKSGTKQKFVREMLKPITRDKYPAISEEEEGMSVPLQTLYGAIFDTVLAHSLNALDKNWASVRKEMCQSLNLGKTNRVIEILSYTYSDADVFFLQEASMGLVNGIKGNPLGSIFHIVMSHDFDPDRNQNSVILLRKSQWSEPTESTSAVLSRMSDKGVGAGDLAVAVATHKPTGARVVLASFHGDTNGLLTNPVVSAVYSFTQQEPRKLIFGLDANAHTKGSHDILGIDDFTQHFVSKEMSSCFGENPNPANYTTFHARTHLQSQLNKGVLHLEQSLKGDRSPKDFILFKRADFSVVSTGKDNTGNREYTENMVFPTLRFPSDHGVVNTVLMMR